MHGCTVAQLIKKERLTRENTDCATVQTSAHDCALCACTVAENAPPVNYFEKNKKINLTACIYGIY